MLQRATNTQNTTWRGIKAQTNGRLMDCNGFHCNGGFIYIVVWRQLLAVASFTGFFYSYHKTSKEYIGSYFPKAILLLTIFKLCPKNTLWSSTVLSRGRAVVSYFRTRKWRFDWVIQLSNKNSHFKQGLWPAPGFVLYITLHSFDSYVGQYVKSSMLS